MIDATTKTIRAWIQDARVELVEDTGDVLWQYVSMHDLRQTWATTPRSESEFQDVMKAYDALVDADIPKIGHVKAARIVRRFPRRDLINDALAADFADIDGISKKRADHIAEYRPIKRTLFQITSIIGRIWHYLPQFATP